MRSHRTEPFRRMVVLGESTVQGGPWLPDVSLRFADVLARLINDVQSDRMEYVNKGIGANAISPRSPGYANSAKPSAIERYRDDVIALDPDLFIFCYGLNDMRAGMDVDEFIEDCRTILADVREACRPVTVVTTVYHMTGWRSFPPYDKGSPRATRVYNRRLGGLAEEQGALLADVWRAQGAADWLVHPDGVHANHVGNLIIAHEIFATLARHCSGLTNAAFAADAGSEWTRHTTQSRANAGDPFRRTW
jgi:lysophospholipase L1-like esterase